MNRIDETYFCDIQFNSIYPERSGVYPVYTRVYYNYGLPGIEYVMHGKDWSLILDKDYVLHYRVPREGRTYQLKATFESILASI